MASSFKTYYGHTATPTAPQPSSRIPPAHTSAGDSLTLPSKSGSVSCGVTFFSWVLMCPVCALQESFSQSYVSSGNSFVGLMVTSSKRAYAIPKSAAPRAPVPPAVPC